MANHIKQAETKAASKAIYKFVNELWEAFHLAEWIDSDRPLGETPTQQKEYTIDCLQLLMEEMATDGASLGLDALLEILKEAGFTYNMKDDVRRNWNRAVLKKIRKKVVPS